MKHTILLFAILTIQTKTFCSEKWSDYTFSVPLLELQAQKPWLKKGFKKTDTISVTAKTIIFSTPIKYKIDAPFDVIQSDPIQTVVNHKRAIYAMPSYFHLAFWHPDSVDLIKLGYKIKPDRTPPKVESFTIYGLVESENSILVLYELNGRKVHRLSKYKNRWMLTNISQDDLLTPLITKAFLDNNIEPSSSHNSGSSAASIVTP